MPLAFLVFKASIQKGLFIKISTSLLSRSLDRTLINGSNDFSGESGKNFSGVMNVEKEFVGDTSVFIFKIKPKEYA